MGLDMYLEAERFVWDSVEIDPNAENLRNAVKNILGDIPGEVKTIITEAIYWCKANAIHKWFVDNIQDGVDECQRSFVKRTQLQVLRDLCQEVIDNPESASTKLPVQSGFFFGDIDYTEWYFDDLTRTVEQLDIILDEVKFPSIEWSFYYQASW